MKGLRWGDRNPQAHPLKILWWEILRLTCGVVMTVCWRFRWWGGEHVPQRGPVLLVCNHQSFLDLIALGVALPRRQFHSMARVGLFRNGFFSALIRSLNAFPVDPRNTIAAMRAAMQRLDAGHVVLIFPEGTRTPDGTVQPFEKGIQLVIRRAKPTVVPAAIEGIYDVWPMHRRFPGRGRAGLAFGEPIEAEKLLEMGDAAPEHLRQQIDAMRLDLRRRIRDESGGRCPLPGPGDEPVKDEARRHEGAEARRK